VRDGKDTPDEGLNAPWELNGNNWVDSEERSGTLFLKDDEWSIANLSGEIPVK